MDENIVRLAERQEQGELPPIAEEALALAFADRYEAGLRHVACWSRWLAFDGARWHLDDTLHAFDRARAICREAALECDKAASAVASAKTVAAVERLAKADRRLAATATQWDAAPWLFNACNDTIDLRTGKRRAPDPLDYLTKQTACTAAPPGTAHPLWTKFL
jgi:putative DNA primase/helicase